MSSPNPQPVDEDAALCRRAGAGEKQAFTLLVRRYQDRVFGLALRMLGHAQEAEDVAQEVFVALHGHVGAFRGDSKVSTWVYRITRNHCLNRIKFLSRRGRRALGPQAHGPDEEPLDQVASPQPGALQVVLASEESRHLEAALGELAPEHREVLILRDVEQLNYDEMMKITGLAEGTIKSRLHRARAALLQKMSAGAQARGETS